MRIAVLADTHDRVPAHLVSLLTPADEIWHLGDACERSILEKLSIRPLRYVRGNCDPYEQGPLELTFELEGFRILLVHIPPRVAPRTVDLLFHGHTHVPRNELVGSTCFYNPGCITRPNRGAPASWAWLELRRGEDPSWSLNYL